MHGCEVFSVVAVGAHAACMCSQKRKEVVPYPTACELNTAFLVAVGGGIDGFFRCQSTQDQHLFDQCLITS